MEITRKKFQGVLNILSFNRHFYVIGLVVMITLIACHLLFHWPQSLLLLIVLTFLYGLIMPLVVSAYVYDFSGYYEFNWLPRVVSDYATVEQIVNINAGFDETSFIIQNKFPHANIKVFDFYNAERHTEPAIKRARKETILYPGTQQIASCTIPLADKSVDVIFLLSAAHEIRSNTEKVIFLKECRRICKEDGQVIMVEHLRDFPNFLAFTIGFTHFFSRSTWEKAFESAGFSSIKELKFTAFMSIFHCNP